MVQQTNITIKDDVWNSDKFQALKKTHQLSKTIDLLLRAHLSLHPFDKREDE